MLQQFFIIVIISVLLTIVFYRKIESPSKKGKAGERRVAAKLSSLPSNEYVILNDLMLRSGTSTTQIDHLVIIAVR